MITAYLKMLRNWKDFSGRTSRKDYWMAYLGNLVVGLILGAAIGIFTGIGTVISEDLGAVIGVIGTVITSLYSLIILIPSISIIVRRLHDQGKSGMIYVWCLLGSLCCGIGSIVLLVFMCLPGIQGPNQYGPDPHGFNGNTFNGYGQPNMYGQNNYGQGGYNNNQY